ncbi:molybdopterin cofactor-binding domain-containing protein [Pukyongiella litopenaei]|uniref:Xanthine dehydrogenase family protein molybdopterin-binding subunit n=1 Tax=Pukyongiella litopenaei TaxID=2605946 RepID=A0A2S0MPA6_9RHOB|nr:molybdopterin cofactor-binding domain-containing protein [Pukyongiella litopenaei]AVO37553.1 xanthine dehydrogenase family protein molybdopterin-binding subunit [Pukyongiella litopenaei]
MTERRRLSRRAFLALGGTATVAVAAGATVYALQAETPLTGQAINAFVAITPDGDIEFVCPGQDIGQGAPVALAMVLAEEVGASMERVRILPAPRDAARYGNPDFSGRMVTADSKTTLGYWPMLRLAGAELRLALIETAARRQGWTARDCKTEAHAVVHVPTGETRGFAEVIAAGRLRMPGAAQGDLKRAKDFDLLGTSPQRPDALEIVTGAKRFGTDQPRGGMSLAVLRRSPHLGGTVVALDATAALATSGVSDVHQLEDQSAVAVVASSTWAAIKGAKALEITWSDAPDFDSETERNALAAALDDTQVAPVAVRGAPMRSATPDAAMFYSPTLSHVLPEPLIASVEGRSLGLGASTTSATQSLDLDMRYGARTWKTAPFMLETQATPSGGSYGRRVLNDVVRDAAEIAKAIGRPVQVIRPQLDEMIRGQVRPAAVQRLSARLDDAGRLVEWRHEIASDGTLATHLPSSMKGANGDEDNTATDGASHPYIGEDQSISWTRVVSMPSPGFLRGVSASYTVWAIETTIERLARDAGLDPLQWRLDHLEDARLRAVISRVGEMSGWSGSDRAFGLGAMIFREARIATVAEVTGTEVTHLWIAVDVGQIVHRKQLLAQVEGGAIWGLSQALCEKLTFAEGVAMIASIADYPMQSNGTLPPIEIETVETPGLSPAGAGEIGVPVTVAAIANAMEAATGVRFDALPLAV